MLRDRYGCGRVDAAHLNKQTRHEDVIMNPGDAPKPLSPDTEGGASYGTRRTPLRDLEVQSLRLNAVPTARSDDSRGNVSRADSAHWVLTEPRRVARDCCVFLDVDGTLLEIAELPDRVRVPDDLTALLARAAATFDGAIALVSGRRIATLDAMFAPLKLSAAGVHGLERRDDSGRIHFSSVGARLLDRARAVLNVLTVAHPGLEVEDKGVAVALHFRRRPELTELCRRLMDSLAEELGPSFHVVEGLMVFELKPSGVMKGTAIEAFHAEPPFAGRLPVVVGNDATDVEGFIYARKRGGVSIAVGTEIVGSCRLPNCVATRRWLRQVAESAGG